MALSHVKSETVADKTGTVTVWDGGGTTTIVATDLVRPSDWNSAHNQYYTLSGNTSLSSTASGSNVVLSAAGAGLTLIGSSDSIVLSTPGLISYFEWPPAAAQLSTQSVAQSTSCVIGFQMPEPISMGFLRFLVSMTNSSTQAVSTGATANASWALSHTFNAVIYSFGTGASSKSLMSVISSSMSHVYRNSISVAANGSQYSTSGGFTYAVETATSSTSTSSAFSAVNYSWNTTWLSNFSGARYFDVPWGTSLQAGPYWIALGVSTNSAQNSTTFSVMSNAFIKYSQHFAVSIQAATNQFSAMGDTAGTFPWGGIGSFSTAGGGTTSAFPASAISSSNSNQRLYFQLINWA